MWEQSYNWLAMVRYKQQNRRIKDVDPSKSQGGNEGGGLGGLGHSGPLVTISSPSVIIKLLVAAQPPQPPQAYVAAAPSHQHQQRPNPKTQQNPS